MHIHILGICGTFMGGLAVLARQAGHRVTGCDANVYPPMSTQLEAQGRHDPCVLPRAVPMVEAMVCLVLADHWLRQQTVDVLPPI